MQHQINGQWYAMVIALITNATDNKYFSKNVALWNHMLCIKYVVIVKRQFQVSVTKFSFVYDREILKMFNTDFNIHWILFKYSNIFDKYKLTEIKKHEYKLNSRVWHKPL